MPLLEPKASMLPELEKRVHEKNEQMHSLKVHLAYALRGVEKRGVGDKVTIMSE